MNSDAVTGGLAENGHARWDAELFLLSAASRPQLPSVIRELESLLADPSLALKDLAYTLNVARPTGPARLAIVASTVDDLKEKLGRAAKRLADPQCRRIRDPRGIYFFQEPASAKGKLAFLFPGEGSQYPNMLEDLRIHFPEVRRWFDLADQASVSAGSTPPSEYIFPRATLSDHERALTQARLWDLDGAVSAVLTADLALFDLLDRFNIHAQAIVGHSTGEFAAMLASGMIEIAGDDAAKRLFTALLGAYKKMPQQDGSQRFVLVAAGCGGQTVAGAAKQAGVDVRVAMDNCTLQAVICGAEPDMDRVVQALQSKGVLCEKLAFNRPYHTTWFRPYIAPLKDFSRLWVTQAPRIPTYTCSTRATFPEDLEQNRFLAVEQWVRPVAFRETIEKMYADGVRTFLEAGARGNLTSFVADILRGRPHLALAMNLTTRSGTHQLCHFLGVLAAQGHDLKLDLLYAHRSPLNLDEAMASKDHPGRRAQPLPIASSFPEMRLSQRTAESLQTKAAQNGAVATTQNKDPHGHNGRVAETRSAASQPAAPPVHVPALSERRSPSGLVANISMPNAQQAVMAAHLRTMDQFLDLQREIMQAYLGGSPSPAPAAAAVIAAPAAGPVFRHECETLSPPAQPAARPMISSIASLSRGDPTLSDAWIAGRMPADCIVRQFRHGMLKPAATASGGIPLQFSADGVLGRRERDFWANSRFSETRRIEWLCGRIVAKDAVRQYLQERHGISVRPADIEILPDASGSPTVKGPWLAGAISAPSLSVSHSGDYAAAVVSNPGNSVGIDIEPVARKDKLNADFLRLALGSIENQLNPGEDPRLYGLFAWCAKEAAAKARRQGLGSGLLSLRVKSADREYGVFTIDSGPGKGVSTAHVHCHEELVVAICVETNREMFQ